MPHIQFPHVNNFQSGHLKPSLFSPVKFSHSYAYLCVSDDERPPRYGKLRKNSLHLFSLDWSSFISTVKKKKKVTNGSWLPSEHVPKRTREGSPRLKPQIFCHLISEVTSYHLCYVLFLETSHSVQPTFRGGYYTKCEHQDAEYIGVHLRLPTTGCRVTDILNTHSVHCLHRSFLP